MEWLCLCRVTPAMGVRDLDLIFMFFWLINIFTGGFLYGAFYAHNSVIIFT